MGNTLRNSMKDLKDFARDNDWGDDIILQLNEFSERDKSVRQVLNYDITIAEKINLLIGD